MARERQYSLASAPFVAAVSLLPAENSWAAVRDATPAEEAKGQLARCTGLTTSLE